MAPEPSARYGFGAALGKDGRIYVIGGVNGFTQDFANDVEAYDPAANRWTSLAPIPTPRDRLAVVAGPDGRIYAIGGDGVGVYFKTVEAYDPATIRGLPWRRCRQL